jgi:hypothetical protein
VGHSTEASAGFIPVLGGAGRRATHPASWGQNSLHVGILSNRFPFFTHINFITNQTDIRLSFVLDFFIDFWRKKELKV